MGKQTSKRLTARERECQQAARDKAKRKWLRAVGTKVKWGSAIVLTVSVVGGGGWFWWSGGLDKTTTRITNGIYKITADAGFTVQATFLEGRARTPMKDVQAVLALKKGAPILGISLDEMRASLETIPTVKKAIITRALPNTLHIQLVERTPVAIWQNKGEYALIDDEGTVMHDLALEDYQGLPLISGIGAPKHVGDVLNFLAAEPELSQYFVAAVRVGDRRWNMRLKKNIEVKLPEEDAVNAWQKFAELNQKQHLLNRDIEAVDLRDNQRYFIKVNPAAFTPVAKPAAAKET